MVELSMQTLTKQEQSIITYSGLLILAVLLEFFRNSFFNLRNIIVIESLGVAGFIDLMQYKTASFLVIAFLLMPLYALVNQYYLFYIVFLSLTGFLLGSLFIEQKTVFHIQAFYFAALVWSPLITSVLFMQLSNHVTPFKAALWFYPLLMSSVGLANLVPISEVQWQAPNLFLLIGVMALIIIIYEVVYRGGINSEEKYVLSDEKLPVFSKGKVLCNKAFWLISLFLMVSIFIEQFSIDVMKKMIKSLDLSVVAYNEMRADYSYFLGAAGSIISCIMIFALPLLGWRIFMVSVSLLGFAVFSAVLLIIDSPSDGQLLAEKVQILLPFLQVVQVMMMILMFVLKEIAYIPFNRHLRIKGKTWIDLVFRPLTVSFTLLTLMSISTYKESQAANAIADISTYLWIAMVATIVLGIVSWLLGSEINKARNKAGC